MSIVLGWTDLSVDEGVEDSLRVAEGILFSRCTLMRVGLGVCLAMAVMAAGCKQHEEPVVAAATPMVPAMKPAPATPIDEKRAEIGGAMWETQWDAIVEKALPAEMLSDEVPKDVRRFCPKFYEMSEVDKRAFWAYFFQALAGAEAGLKPTSRVRHTEPEVAVTDGVTGRAVRSEGLLQLTYEDARRYGCDFDWAADKQLKANDPAKTILQPKNNLECGVKILDKQIIDQHKRLLSGSGYWSTLRPGGASYRVFAKQMTNVPPACGIQSGARRRVNVAAATHSGK